MNDANEVCRTNLALINFLGTDAVLIGMLQSDTEETLIECTQ